MSSAEMVPTASTGQYRIVLAAGLATTALALFAVYLLNAHTQFNPMGFYANYVIPVGAILVGLAAASGYGIASWLSGVKITKALLWTVILLQVMAYFAAHYIEFRSLHLVHRDGSAVGFFEYFDWATRAFAWKQKDGSMGQPLGALGYALRALEIGGFILGGALVPLILRGKAYCEACHRYVRGQGLGLLPAGVAPKKISKRDTKAQAAFAAAAEQALADGNALFAALVEKATAGDATGFRSLLAEHKGRQKAYGKLTGRIDLTLRHCPGCHQGHLGAAFVVGKGESTRRSEIGRFPVTADFVRAVRQE